MNMNMLVLDCLQCGHCKKDLLQRVISGRNSRVIKRNVALRVQRNWNHAI